MKFIRGPWYYGLARPILFLAVLALAVWLAH